MALDIVGAAFPRTGTFSLKLALERLGFGPCHHMAEVLAHPETAPLWIAAADGAPDWDTIFKDYHSCVDAPSCFFWRQIWSAYPGARVILTERDPEEWFASTQATVFSPMWRARTAKMPLKDFFNKIINSMGENMHNHDFMVARYREYCDEVKRTVPGDQLLVLKIGEGWERLCRFLGVDVPEEPYPKSNTREELKAMMDMMAAQGDAMDFNAIAEKTHGLSAKRAD